MRIVLLYLPQLCSPNCTPLKNIPVFSAQILTCLFWATTQSNCYYNLIHKLTVHQLHLNFKNHSYTCCETLSTTTKPHIILSFKKKSAPIDFMIPENWNKPEVKKNRNTVFKHLFQCYIHFKILLFLSVFKKIRVLQFQ